MNPIAPRSVLSGVWQRRLAKTPLRRREVLPARALSISAPVMKQRSKPAPSNPYSEAALSAFLSRLSLPACPSLHPALMAALTHPSYAKVQEAIKRDAEAQGQAAESAEADAAATEENNELLASLGNSLLGLFASEHLAARYPNLPSSALKSAVTAYVGPASLVSVGRELGLGVQAETKRSTYRANAVLGMPIRWRRESPEAVAAAQAADVETPVAPGFREKQKAVQARRAASWEEGVASVVRALVGLIYQDQGIHAARQFVEAHFLTRHVDLTSIFQFRRPKYILSNVVSKHLVDAGVTDTAVTGRIESRVLASTGVNTQAPLFNIGLFLPNGLKLAEGHGSSLAMAEHRAATNALLSLFLVRSDVGSSVPPTLPTSVHASRPITSTGVAAAAAEALSGHIASGNEAAYGLAKAGARRH